MTRGQPGLTGGCRRGTVIAVDEVVYRCEADLPVVYDIDAKRRLVVTETALDQFFNPGTRRAFVATHDGVFGMARMYSLHAESLGQTIEVFRELAPARAWIDA
jgi:hypothetical protein